VTGTVELSLGSVIGHSEQIRRLRQEVAAGSVSHAYWISGPPRIGKTTVALALASELLSAEGWPHGLLEHPDLWFDATAGNLKIERITTRDADQAEGPTLQHFLSMTAYAGRAKVAVIANAERLTPEAANSLLRILEEPPPGSVICLTTSRPDSERLPNTLRSRCNQILLGPVDSSTISSWLVGRSDCSTSTAEVAAAISQGAPGLALELVADPELEERNAQAVAALVGCLERGPGGLLQVSQEIAERGKGRDQVVLTFRNWVAFLRDCCRLAAGAGAMAGLPSWEDKSRSLAAELGLAECLRRYDLALDSLARLDEGANPRLVLDRFLLLAFTGSRSPRPVTGG
jgi:DNA polymerase-3 subunit delta'